MKKENSNAILQIIYTLENGQCLANFPFDRSIIKTKKSLIDFATAALTGKYCFVPDTIWKDGINYRNRILPKTLENVPKIHKLSCCIIANNVENIKCPTWYNEENGKIWFNDLHPNETNPYL